VGPKKKEARSFGGVLELNIGRCKRLENTIYLLLFLLELLLLKFEYFLNATKKCYR
jgi:hypothetical protein